MLPDEAQDEGRRVEDSSEIVLKHIYTIVYILIKSIYVAFCCLHVTGSYFVVLPYHTICLNVQCSLFLVLLSKFEKGGKYTSTLPL